MDKPLKLICLNIEGHLHLDKVMPFLLGEKPDVVCIQEVFESEVAWFEDKLHMSGAFAPHAIKSLLERQEALYGVAIFAKELKNIKADYYFGSAEKVQRYHHPDQHTHQRALLHADVIKNGVAYHIGTTHFTWTPNGEADDTQRADLKSLLRLLSGIPEIIFCGDFNAPRGKEIFQELARHYKDNIPPQYTTSLDKNYHRAGALPYMVDGLFSTPHYVAENARLADGVSDHMAIVADIKRK